METLILTQPDVRRLLPMDECIDLMADALATLARDGAVNPLRTATRLPARKGILGLMPGAIGTDEGLDTFGLKIVSVLPGNHGTEYDSHQGLVVLFDSDHGLPLVILDASEVTAIRTAAVSGLATRLLAREGAGDLALVGSGVQARTHLEAMRAVRGLRRVRVYSPTLERVRAFAARESERHGLVVEVVGSAREAVEGADLVCTTTSSRDPVVLGEWLAPGAHVNAVGSSVASARELDGPAVARSRVYVDRRESTFNESGDFLLARDEGLVDDDHVLGELGEILTERVAGRGDADEITLFISLGLAVEDLVAARYVHERARREGVGVTVPLGGLAT